jgi:hypothetical protein
MKEIEQNGHDDERILLVFNALDQIIPQLGVFSPIAAKLRQELFGSPVDSHRFSGMHPSLPQISCTAIISLLSKCRTDFRRAANELHAWSGCPTKCSAID